MENKYLEKAASLDGFKTVAKKSLRDFRKGFRDSSTTSKIGLGMSATGLGLSVSNYNNGKANLQDNKERKSLEATSLQTLQNIAESLKKPQRVVVKVNPGALEKKAIKLSDAKTYGRAALQLAARNPATVGLGTLGAVDGAMRTTRKKDENIAKTVLRGMRNTAEGALYGAAAGKILEVGHGLIKRKAGL